MNSKIPLIIDFIEGSRLKQEEETAEHFTIWGARRPGTFVLFSRNKKVSLPTDQIVLGEDAHGAARVGLGGMSFEGIDGGKLIFWRVRDLMPDPDFFVGDSDKITLESSMVSAVFVDGEKVWPKPNRGSPAPR